MSGTAIIMMVLFIVIIWGGFVTAWVNLTSHPDETAGELGEHPYATNEELAALERQ